MASDHRIGLIPVPRNRNTGERCLLPWQVSLMRSNASRIVVSGGRGAGKSEGLIFKALQASTRNPGSPILLSMPTGPLLETVLVPKLQRLIVEYRELNGHSLERRWHKSKNYIELRNASRWYLRPMDNPEKMRGPDYTFWGADELPQVPYICNIPESAIIEIMTGTRRGGDGIQWVFTGTPRGDVGMVGECVDALLSGDTIKIDRYDLIIARSAENTALPPEFISDLAAVYDDQMRRQELEGEIIRFRGGVFSKVYDPIESIIDYQIDPLAPTWIGVDWGTAYLTAVFLQDRVLRDYGSCDVVFHEITRTGDNLRDFQRAIVEYCKARGIKNVTVCPDKRGADMNRDLRVLFAKEKSFFNGMTPEVKTCIPREERIMYGIQLLMSLLKDGTGKRTLLFSSRLSKKAARPDDRPILQALEQYEWEEKKGEPRKEFRWTHSIDALRYIAIIKHRVRGEILEAKNTPY
jgi:phage terminase large subunit-like protein